MKRTINILGIEKLIEKIKNWKPDYKRAARLFSKPIQLEVICGTLRFELKEAA